MQEIWVQYLGWEDPLEKGIAAHSSILAWRIPWKEELGGLQSMGSQRVGHNWATNTFTLLSSKQCMWHYDIGLSKLYLGIKKHNLNWHHSELSKILIKEIYWMAILIFFFLMTQFSSQWFSSCCIWILYSVGQSVQEFYCHCESWLKYRFRKLASISPWDAETKWQVQKEFLV